MRKLMCAFLLTGLLSGCWKYSTGQKTGYIVKVAKEGFWWGTYEGELIRGGFDNGTGANGKAFHFSFGVFNSKVLERAKRGMDKNETVLVTYHCEAWVAPWRGAHKCLVDGIKAHG